MTKERILNEINCILEELNYDNAVSYLTQDDKEWLEKTVELLEQQGVLFKSGLLKDCEACRAEQQPCEDAISRQNALDVLHMCLSTNSYDDDVTGDSYICYEEAEYEIEKLPSVQPKPIECEDAISRKEALEALEQEEPLVWCDGADEIAAHSQWSSDVDTIKNMPPVQPKYNANEWCHDCSEYDHEKHCCPRFNGVIRKAVDKIAKMESEGTDADSH